MFKKFRQILFPLGITSFVLAALSWDIRSPQSLPATAGYVFSQDDEGEVYIEAKVLSQEKTREYVHRDIVSRGYQTILLQIDNTTPFSYELKRSEAKIEASSAKSVVWEVGKSTLPRSFAFSILGFLFWPFSIPSTIDSIHTWNTQYVLHRELTAKTLKDEGEIIPPYASVSRLLYIPQNEMKESFQLSLKNLDEGEVEDFYLLVKGVA